MLYIAYVQFVHRYCYVSGDNDCESPSANTDYFRDGACENGFFIQWPNIYSEWGIDYDPDNCYVVEGADFVELGEWQVFAPYENPLLGGSETEIAAQSGSSWCTTKIERVYGSGELE